MGSEKRSEYQKSYKKYHYKKTRKIITFPLLLEEFELLKNQAEKMGMSNNKMAKEIVLNYFDLQPQKFQTKEQLDLIKEYMRISRGIATNINQMAYSSNIGEMVDINILIASLKNYEDEFKTLVSKVL